MKAINFFVLNILAISLFISCKPQDQEPHFLDGSSKEYFDIHSGSKFIYTETTDTNVSLEYVCGNYLSGMANPDIENSEYISYDLSSSGLPTYNIRLQSVGSEYKDQIALVTSGHDSVYIGPVLFNFAGKFSTGSNSGDSVFQYPTYSINSVPFTDVIRVKLRNHLKFYEVYYAKHLGMIARKEKNNKFYYLKRYSLK